MQELLEYFLNCQSTLPVYMNNKYQYQKQLNNKNYTFYSQIFSDTYEIKVFY